MKSQAFHVLLTTVLPAMAVSVLYGFFLGHRRDYLGHYAAGYGGTLTASMVVLAALPPVRFAVLAPRAVVLINLMCILPGAVAEATVFRLAKFDEVDFCNQSFGAVLAGLAALASFSNSKPPDWALRMGIAVGFIYLVVGAYFAFT